MELMACINLKKGLFRRRRTGHFPPTGPGRLNVGPIGNEFPVVATDEKRFGSGRRVVKDGRPRKSESGLAEMLCQQD